MTRRSMYQKGNENYKEGKFISKCTGKRKDQLIKKIHICDSIFQFEFQIYHLNTDIIVAINFLLTFVHINLHGHTL